MDKGIEISSKIKNMKTGKNLETNALNRKLCKIVYDEQRKSVTSLESSYDQNTAIVASSKKSVKFKMKMKKIASFKDDNENPSQAL